MRISPVSSSFLFASITALLPAIAFADTPVDDPSSRLIVTVREYRTDVPPSPGTSSAEVARRFLEGESEPVRTIRMPTIDNCEAHFSNGERIYLPQLTSSGKADRGEVRPVAVGTIFQVTAKRTSKTVLMQFNYTTSSLVNENAADSIPRVKETTVQGTYSFQLGEPVLIGGLTESNGIYLIATVTVPQERQTKN